MALYIYGTVFNNVDRAMRSIKSISKLRPKSIFITDNFSTDGTYEVLTRTKGVKIIRNHCSHGKGRQLALDLALQKAKDDDFVMYIDLDTIYNLKFVKLIEDKMKTLNDNEVFIFGMLSKARINKRIKWHDLYTSEDLERHAHFKHAGYKIVGTREQFLIQYGGMGLYNQYYENDISVGDNFYKRHSRYKTSRIKFFIRMVKILIDNERGVAYKSFHDFFNQSTNKGVKMRFAYFFAYIIAKILGVYGYDEELNNLNYVLSSSL